MLKKNFEKEFDQGHQQHYFWLATLEQLYTALYLSGLIIVTKMVSNNTRSAVPLRVHSLNHGDFEF